jgi:hypothetical protein
MGGLQDLVMGYNGWHMITNSNLGSTTKRQLHLFQNGWQFIQLWHLAQHKCSIKYLYVKVAFLNWELQKEMFTIQPQGFVQQD